jgi:hypothetical protein
MNEIMTDALFALSEAAQSLSDARCEADGVLPVSKWCLDPECAPVWDDGFAAGIRAALRAISDNNPDDVLARAATLRIMAGEVVSE